MLKLSKSIKLVFATSAILTALSACSFAESIKLDSQNATITSANVNIRSGPGINYVALLQIPHKNTEVNLLEKDGNWYKISYKGNKGWVIRDFITLKNNESRTTELSSRSNNNLNNRTDALRNAIVESAKKCIGIPYLWGGYSEKGNKNAPNPQNGLDCSGFAYYIYSIYNIKLNGGRSTAANQATEGIEVSSKDNLKLGDLVFFQSPYESEISHVAIYIGENEAGVKQIIHAASSAKKIVISNLDTQPNYKTARRIIVD